MWNVQNEASICTCLLVTLRLEHIYVFLHVIVHVCLHIYTH